jgi:hypothetical protein
MALYLQMDGVDDKLVAANMLYDEIVMDINTEYVSGTPYYFSSRLVTNGSYSSSTGAEADFTSAGVTRTLNGTTTTTFFPRNQRIVTGFKMTTAVTHGVYIFARDNNSSYRKGNIYDVKIYYQGVLKAHYDMTTGTVQDQSGNGNHATLTGGTWLDDGGGGTGATINAVTANSNADTIAPVVTTQQQVSVPSVIADTIADALSPSVGSFTNISVSAVIVSATADAISPSVEAVLNIGIEATIADVTADARAPFVGSSESSQITAVIASLTADVIAPSVYTSQDSQIDSVIAELTADAMSPVIQTDAMITAIISDLHAAGIADTLRVIIGDLAQYNEVIRIVLNISRNQTSAISITRKQASTLGITQRKQSELNL